MKLEEELEKVSRVLSDGFECKGRYCEHETSEKHYIVEKSLIEQFIINALESKMSDLRKEVEKKRKYHKEFECNGAFNGRGCYESWCEDQDCRNAPKEYNSALDEVLLLMKK